jgi:hypothetical protein
MGLSPELALKALKQEAHTQAANAAAVHSPPVARSGRAPASSRPSPSGMSGGRPGSASGMSSGRPARAGDYLLPDDDPQVWRFEVVDVRLAPALMEGGERGWLAYGTLLSEGEQPPLAAGRWRPSK